MVHGLSHGSVHGLVHGSVHCLVHGFVYMVHGVLHNVLLEHGGLLFPLMSTLTFGHMLETKDVLI